MRSGGTIKKNKPTPKKRWTWEGECTVRNCLTWCRPSCQSLLKQTNNAKKNPIRDSKECKRQAIEFDLKNIQVTFHVAWKSSGLRDQHTEMPYSLVLHQSYCYEVKY